MPTFFKNKFQNILFLRSHYVLLFYFILFFVSFLILFNSVAVFSITILFIFVTIFGFYLCNLTAYKLKDNKLRILGLFWLLKIGLTIMLFYIGWLPELNPNNSSWGYDPQRFYLQSIELLDNDWDNSFVSLNYKGILYYYALIFSLFGRNPVIPALVNIFVTLIGTLFLIRSAYNFVRHRKSSDWLISLTLLIPEVLWYDVMTSRESLMSVLLVLIIMSIGNYLNKFSKSILRTITVVVLSLLGIMAVRTSMVIPALISIFFITFFLKSENKLNALAIKLFFVLLIIIAMFSGTVIIGSFGSGDIDYLSTLERLQSPTVSIDDPVFWSQNSIGLLLVPTNIFESLLFLIPRMLLYLVSPLPNISVSVLALWSGSWSAFQSLMTIPTSLLIMLGFPFVLSASEYSWHLRKIQPSLLIIPISFWVIFISVAGGNQYIHERYRIMSTMLLFTTMWIGYTRCNNKLNKKWFLIWFLLLFVGVIFYLIIKFI